MEKSFDKWPPLIPDNMFHVMSTYPLFGVMVERKDGRGSAQIVFGLALFWPYLMKRADISLYGILLISQMMSYEH